MKRKMISIMMLGLMLTMLTGCVHYASPESGKELFSSLGISILVMAVGGVIYDLYWLFGRNSPWFKGKEGFLCDTAIIETGSMALTAKGRAVIEYMSMGL